MTDRELLEAAAMAAGVTGGVWWDDTCDGWPDPSTHWNPLADDGDALRLAVKLGMSIVYADGQIEILFEGRSGFAFNIEGDNISFATRRAIVRAAAAMAPKELR